MTRFSDFIENNEYPCVGFDLFDVLSDDRKNLTRIESFDEQLDVSVLDKGVKRARIDILNKMHEEHARYENCRSVFFAFPKAEARLVVESQRNHVKLILVLGKRFEFVPRDSHRVNFDFGVGIIRRIESSLQVSSDALSRVFKVRNLVHYVRLSCSRACQQHEDRFLAGPKESMRMEGKGKDLSKFLIPVNRGIEEVGGHALFESQASWKSISKVNRKGIAVILSSERRLEEEEEDLKKKKKKT